MYGTECIIVVEWVTTVAAARSRQGAAAQGGPVADLDVDSGVRRVVPYVPICQSSLHLQAIPDSLGLMAVS